jgi:MFS family permease
MQHSYDQLDRAGGYSWVNPLAPLRHRDFRRLWIGMTASLLGDGVFVVAMAWQVYELSNAPAALSMVGIAMTIPTIVLLLFGGVVSDRVERRRVLIGSDVLRGAAVAVMALLSLTGSLELWHMMVLVAVYGAGTAFFGPAFDAIVPDLLPENELAQANALDQFVRPVAFRLVGPMMGGWMIAGFGVGTAFALDGITFAVSAAAALSMRALPAAEAGGGSMLREIRVGLSFVKANVWIWGTLVSAAFAYLLFLGPTEVLLPYVVKNDIGGSAGDLGLVFGAGGLGAVLCALAMGTRGSPRRPILFIYVTWTFATVAVAGYGISSAVWQLMAASFVFNALETAGTIVWVTTKQRHVPSALLGRVSSLDWLISIGLLPVSFALTGPVAAAIGAQETLIMAGVVGSVITVSALCLPGMRDLDQAPAEPLADISPAAPEARRAA